MSEFAVYSRSEAVLLMIAKARRHAARVGDDAAGPRIWDLQQLWRVLGLNQRRLSRRFYSELRPSARSPLFAGLRGPEGADPCRPDRV
jgi:hypothetical protein